MNKVDWWLKLIDDSLLKYHYRRTDGRMDNTKSRVAFATERSYVDASIISVVLVPQTKFHLTDHEYSVNHNHVWNPSELDISVNSCQWQLLENKPIQNHHKNSVKGDKWT